MNFAEFLYRALDARIGIIVLTSDVKRFQAKLYETRRKAENPDFELLTFAPSRTNPATELWIVRKQVKPDGSTKG